MRNELSAREAVLARIEAANAGPVADVETISAAWQQLPRAYRRMGIRSLAERLQLLEERLQDYGAVVTRCRESDIAEAVDRLLRQEGEAPSVVVPKGFPKAWLPVQIETVEDDDLSARTLERFDVVLTGASMAIAETGTLVLQNVPGQGRRVATLVPDFHLCVVRACDVVETVPEAFLRLATTSTLPTTFVSGPSATADIEMTRIKGVHGPRFLSVLLVEDASGLC